MRIVPCFLLMCALTTSAFHTSAEFFAPHLLHAGKEFNEGHVMVQQALRHMRAFWEKAADPSKFAPQECAAENELTSVMTTEDCRGLRELGIMQCENKAESACTGDCKWDAVGGMCSIDPTVFKQKIDGVCTGNCFTTVKSALDKFASDSSCTGGGVLASMLPTFENMCFKFNGEYCLLALMNSMSSMGSSMTLMPTERPTKAQVERMCKPCNVIMMGKMFSSMDMSTLGGFGAGMNGAAMGAMITGMYDAMCAKVGDKWCALEPGGMLSMTDLASLDSMINVTTFCEKPCMKKVILRVMNAVMPLIPGEEGVKQKGLIDSVLKYMCVKNANGQYCMDFFEAEGDVDDMGNQTNCTAWQAAGCCVGSAKIILHASGIKSMDAEIDNMTQTCGITAAPCSIDPKGKEVRVRMRTSVKWSWVKKNKAKFIAAVKRDAAMNAGIAPDYIKEVIVEGSDGSTLSAKFDLLADPDTVVIIVVKGIDDAASDAAANDLNAALSGGRVKFTETETMFKEDPVNRVASLSFAPESGTTGGTSGASRPGAAAGLMLFLISFAMAW
eukprot:CAMPEP_0174286750 /NCGR_PEP_ID=MMETSP0809-20121228/12850_1 /TAXON_ID=73025 ORGANISM="Eutreptiella gymnastica-like, Strain CCMP1594" /NCGR_SAMPLE_ID=MMETSP0809 /ASSEMBLY_ACC=CAM_ASM_000658 /LENGTH=555 /DNA_ID=CAMNT_0015382931 /DNA_START=16 /DNA_END=1680 /DNA_ORIENTATION=-